ncbi:MAG TPA: hypothetical protein PKW42_05650, partial [bacterium]|nr:hypothetical protein [bacterium]
PEGETVYVVMPQPPQQPTRHQLGANISLTPAEIQVQARLGLKWVLTCKTREIASADEGVHPRPDVWNWADEKALYPSRFGMNLLPCFWPHRIPPFLQEKLDDPGRYRTVRGRDQQYRPRLDLWSDYVSTVASHYRKVVQHWCVDDEAECSWTPDYYAPVVAATADAVHKAVPEAKVGLSATPEFTEELFRYVSPEKIDFLGGSFFDYYYHEAKYLNQLKQRYRKPVISFGVGGRPPENTMYHTLYTFQPPYFKAAWMARLLVYQMLVSDLDISGHYAGILRNDGAHLGLNKPLCDYDGTPYPWGATFGCLGTLLADAQPCGEVPLGTTGRLVFLFQTRNKLAGVTWSTNVPENDMHWKPAVRKLKKVQLACPPGSIELFDMYWNKLAGIRQQKKTISFDLEEEPVFIINQKLSPEQFRKIFETCQVAPEPVEMELWPQASVSGEISLRITVKNNTSSTYRQALVDFRYPNPVSSINNPLSTAGSWLVPKAISLPSLAGKETKVVNVACAYQADYPLEAAVLRTVFKAEECETASDHWLWLVPCFPINIKLDGLLDEWEKKPASWLAYQRHWNFSYRWSQFLEGEGSFGYPSYTLDSRVAFWAGYDRENLYLAVRAEDEQILPAGELIRIFLAVAPEKPFRLDIEVPEKEKWSARLTTAQSQSLPEPAISGKVQEKQFTLEVAVPWKSLQLSPEPGKILAFDLYRTDVDVENGKKESGTMHWAGGARYGYLILR